MSRWGAKQVVLGVAFTLTVMVSVYAYLDWLVHGQPLWVRSGWFGTGTSTGQGNGAGVAAGLPARDYILLPPLPPPEQLTFVGEEGTDPYGYPLKRVDAIALQTALRHRRFDDLTRYFAEIDVAYREDFRRERWLADAHSAFDTSDPRLTGLLDEWVAAQPQAAAPLLARARHRRAVAWKHRGRGVISTVNGAQQVSFGSYLAGARADLEAALRMDTHLMAGWIDLFNVGAELGDGAVAGAAIARARAECPRCTGPYEAMQSFLRPRWGGSYAAMDALALEARASLAENPALAVVAGFSHADRCNVEEVAHRYDRALEACNQAVAAGAHSTFLADRSSIYAWLERFEEALADADAALRLKPQSQLGLEARYHALVGLDRYALAAETFRTLAYLDPARTKTLGLTAHAAQGLTRGAHGLVDTRRDAGMAMLDDALVFMPGYQPAQDLLSYMLQWQTNSQNPDRMSIEQVQARALAEPDNFHAQRDYDAALARAHRMPEILAIWDAYLVRHPLDARAYRERSGTHHQLGDSAAHRRDALRGCELGDAIACRYAR